jgi:hypothetical protein
MDIVITSRRELNDYDEYEQILIFKWLQSVRYHRDIYIVDNKHACHTNKNRRRFWEDGKEKKNIVRPFFPFPFYGCMVCGKYHICRGRERECTCIETDDDMSLVCIYSGLEISKANFTIGKFEDEIIAHTEMNYMSFPSINNSQNKSIIKRGKKRGRKAKQEKENTIIQMKKSRDLLNHEYDNDFYPRRKKRKRSNYDDEEGEEEEEEDSFGNNNNNNNNLQETLSIQRSDYNHNISDVNKEKENVKNIRKGGGGEEEEESTKKDDSTISDESYALYNMENQYYNIRNNDDDDDDEYECIHENINIQNKNKKVIQYHDNKAYWSNYYNFIEDEVNEIEHLFSIYGKNKKLSRSCSFPSSYHHHHHHKTYNKKDPSIKKKKIIIINEEIVNEIRSEVKKITNFFYITQQISNDENNPTITEKDRRNMSKLCDYYCFIITNIIILVYESPKMKRYLEKERKNMKNIGKYKHKLSLVNKSINNHQKNRLSVKKICASLLLDLFLQDFYLHDDMGYNIAIWNKDKWLYSIKTDEILSQIIIEKKKRRQIKRNSRKFNKQGMNGIDNRTNDTNSLKFNRKQITAWTNDIKSHIKSYNASCFWLREKIYKNSSHNR